MKLDEEKIEDEETIYVPISMEEYGYPPYSFSDEELDEIYECAECGKCCFGVPMVKERHQTYEEKATCLDCAMKEDAKHECNDGCMM